MSSGLLSLPFPLLISPRSMLILCLLIMSLSHQTAIILGLVIIPTILIPLVMLLVGFRAQNHLDFLMILLILGSSIF